MTEKHNSRISLVMVILLLTVINAGARTINIPDDFETIQAGIDASEDGDTVLVQPGEYVENINFSGKAINVIGDLGFHPDCVIDGGGNGPVVTFSNNEGDESRLSGFEIRNGAAEAGGGILISGSSPRLSYLEIISNSAANGGGGVACLDNAQPILTEVNIMNNESGTIGGGFYSGGNSSPVLSDCFISGNSTGISGGQVACWGAEITMRNVGVYGERDDVPNMGGGIYITRGVATLDHVIVEACNAQLGGGLSIWNSTVDMNWVQVGYNEATGTGAGFYVDHSTLSINHLTCVYNSAANGWAGGMFNSDVELTITNSIFWSNEAGNVPQMVLHAGSFDISYCDIEGGMNGVDNDEGELNWENNMDEDPEFFSVNEGDFSLRDNSPCIDSGDPEADPDPDGTRADMGMFYFHQRDIAVEPLEVHFPPMPEDGFDSLAVSISNEGGTPLSIITILNSENMPWIWAAEHWDGDNPIVIDPFESYSLWIYARPAAGISNEVFIFIESDDPDESEVVIHADGELLGVEDDIPQPSSFALSPVYPNPFNDFAQIGFQLDRSGKVRLTLFDLTGKEVRSIINGNLTAGQYTVPLDGTGLPGGLYLIELTKNNRKLYRKAVLMK